ncbi:transposable element Tc1 transposase [Trichonephila clavipes]|nr:transposable element Tc1 transposase [Trichonephila clavipes]
MPPRRNKGKFQQLTEFERGRIIVLRERGFSYRAIGARVQRNSSTVKRVWNQWTGEHRTTRKTGSGRRKVTSAHDDRHLLSMAVYDRTASFRKLAALWSIATGVLMSASSTSAATWIACKGALIQDPLPRQTIKSSVLQWAHEPRAWQADWHQVVLSDESRFNLWDYDGRIRVRRYAGKRCLPECVIERHSGLTFGVMQDNACPHVAKTVRDFSSAQQMQLLPWPAYSPDMSTPIEHVWNSVGRRLARDPRPAVSKDELLLCIQAIWNSLSQADVQNLFDSMPRRIAARIAALHQILISDTQFCFLL